MSYASNHEAREPKVLHEFKNSLAIILGFVDLLLMEMSDTDPRRLDLVEIQKAARTALALVPRLTQGTLSH